MDPETDNTLGISFHRSKEEDFEKRPFDDVEKKFQTPNAFLQGFLKLEE